MNSPRLKYSLMALIFLVLTVTATGCVTPPVKGITTAYYSSEMESPSGSIIILPTESEKARSLEFRFVSAKLADRLKAVGFALADSPEEADYVVLMSYGIDNGTTELSSVPVVGQTGGGTTYSSGAVYGAAGSATYSGSTYQMPTYGIVGSQTVSSTSYKRVISIHILKAGDLANRDATPQLESTTTSSGWCSVINPVLDEMLEGAFIEFPGENGVSRKWTVALGADFQC